MSTQKSKKYNPTPVRLGEYKAELQQWAMQQDRSLNWLMVKLAKDFLKTLNQNKND